MHNGQVHYFYTLILEFQKKSEEQLVSLEFTGTFIFLGSFLFKLLLLDGKKTSKVPSAAFV